jgi:hypothetical protein
VIVKNMKIKLSELRRIIREEIKRGMGEEAVPPGKWAANTGEPASPWDLERLGEDDEEDEA